MKKIVSLILATLLFQLDSVPLAAEESPSVNRPSSPGGLYHPALAKLFNDHSLVDSGGKNIDPQRLFSKKYLFVYFSGYYCGPCKLFTPHLADFYKKYFTAGDFELLFISMDPDKPTMMKYMNLENMKWPALGFHDPSTQAVGDLVGWKAGYPFLALLDENDQVIGKPQPDQSDHHAWFSVNVWLLQHKFPPMHWDFWTEFNKKNPHAK